MFTPWVEMSHLEAFTIETILSPCNSELVPPQFTMHLLGSKHYTMKAVRKYMQIERQFFQKDKNVQNNHNNDFFLKLSSSAISSRIPFQIFPQV